MESPKYAKFDILEVPYKIVNDHKIQAYILVPKNPSPGKHPIIAEFHGGFFMTGTAIYPEWFAQWVLDYGLLHSAIIVSANYRLLPESTGLDMLEDVTDFWTWLRSDFQKHLSSFKPGIEADLEKVIVHGGSAGGTLAIQSGLTQPAGSIKAVLAAYPGLKPGAIRERPIMGAPIVPLAVWDEFSKNMKPGNVVTSAVPPERIPIALSLNQQGRVLEFFGEDERLFPMKVLEKATYLPFVFLSHGKDDSAVPVDWSISFAEEVGKKFGESNIDLRIEPGEHGFDIASTLDMPWLSGALEKVTQLWLGAVEG